MDCVLMETSAYKEMQAHLQRLLERVSALHSLSAQPTTVRWLTAEEVCKALSITKRALQYYRSAGIIPYTALGNKVLFRDDDIRHLLEKNLIKSYMSGVPQGFCILFALAAGLAVTGGTFYLSRRFGPYGLQKLMASRRHPRRIIHRRAIRRLLRIRIPRTVKP